MRQNQVKSGGLLLLFNQDRNIELIKQTKTFQFVKVTTQSAELELANVYLKPSLHINEVRTELKDLSLSLETEPIRQTKKCTIVGDMSRKGNPQFQNYDGSF